MNIYSLVPNDASQSSWLIYEVVRISVPDKPLERLPRVFYKFYPQKDVELKLKSQYRQLVCLRCGRFAAEDVYQVGFFDPYLIRIKGDFGITDDRVFIINENMKSALEWKKIAGYETKPIGGSGWYAVKITCLVNHADNVVKIKMPRCPDCKRPKEAFGIFECMSQIEIPNEPLTLFSTKGSWPRIFRDREIFMTEPVVDALIDAGISGGACTRLLTDEEAATRRQKEKEGKFNWMPRGQVRGLK